MNLDIKIAKKFLEEKREALENDRVLKASWIEVKIRTFPKSDLFKAMQFIVSILFSPVLIASFLVVMQAPHHLESIWTFFLPFFICFCIIVIFFFLLFLFVNDTETSKVKETKELLKKIEEISDNFAESKILNFSDEEWLIISAKFRGNDIEKDPEIERILASKGLKEKKMKEKEWKRAWNEVSETRDWILYPILETIKKRAERHFNVSDDDFVLSKDDLKNTHAAVSDWGSNDFEFVSIFDFKKRLPEIERFFEKDALYPRFNSEGEFVLSLIKNWGISRVKL